MKLFEIKWKCNLSPITFPMSFPKVFRKTIGLNNLGELYNNLLGFGMTTVVDISK